MISIYPDVNTVSGLQTQAISTNAKPFMKWVGGKQQLLTQFEAYFPLDFERYFEPFVGGGAVFFHLWNGGGLPEDVFLLDNNAELINAYRVVRDQLNELICNLLIHQASHNREYYYKIRNLDRQQVELSDVERAARTIYLNRTCYNGLYRVNSKGQFNVPMGSYKNPQILYRDVLLSANEALQNVTLEVSDFRDLVEYARPGDFFYFDPPYDPVSKTASFTGYTAKNFQDSDQQDLAALFVQLTSKGCLCMLSNSYTPFILDLYKNFRVEIVHAKRAVNSDAKGRGIIREVVILNY